MYHCPSIQLQQTQSLKQTQKLIMSAQMQQAIYLLQLPVNELVTLIEQEVSQNPLLELHENIDSSFGSDMEVTDSENYEPHIDVLPIEKELYFKEGDFSSLSLLDEESKAEIFTDCSPLHDSNQVKQEEELRQFYENSLQAERSLFEHIMQQARWHFSHPYELYLCEIIAGNLDEKGFLGLSLEELISFYQLEDLPVIQRVLKILQTFEPFGIAANSLQESFAIQLRCLHKEDSNAFKIIQNCYDHLVHNRIPCIAKECGISIEEVKRAIHEDIRHLSWRPASAYTQLQVQYIVPDAFIILEGKELHVVLNEEEIPHFSLNKEYLDMYRKSQLTDEERIYIKEKLTAGKWLFKNIHLRNETLRRILNLLVQKQESFFKNPQGTLHPMTMKSLAVDLELHESTVTRAISNKYIESPRGLLSLRSFFTHGYNNPEGDDISAHTVKTILLELLKAENPYKPFSDEAISLLLQNKGISCARRTVAKYRQELNIANTAQRRKYSNA